jgi:nucleotide-binding universal stress UspA family protein
MYTKIAVATDGSPQAGKAVKTAVDLAVSLGSELTVIHVLMHGEPPESLKRMAEVEHLFVDEPHVNAAFSTAPGPMMNAATDAERHRLDHKIIATVGRKVVERTKNKALASGVSSVKGEILEGDITEKILDSAKRNEADLIVLGARGLSPLKGLLMGSISQKVSQLSDCACLFGQAKCFKLSHFF